MKLIVKIKNYFYDEEEAEESKKDDLPKVDTIKIKTDSKTVKKDAGKDSEDKLNVISDRELFKSDPTFNFPIIFDDEDLKEEKVDNQRITTMKKEQIKIEETIEKKIFKPSPIISPVFGLIDEQQKSVADATNNDVGSLLNLYDDNKKIDIDDILGKVYEQKRVEINKETYSQLENDSNKVSKDDISLDFFNNIEDGTKEEIKSKIEITKQSISTVDEKLKTIDELLGNTNDNDFYSLVDSMYKDDENGEGDI